jgi:ABC-type antimicrobial peptide transport system ATPase subunit
MTFRRSSVSVVFALFLGGLLISVAKAQQTSGFVKAVQVTGLAGVKDNTKGSLSVENGSLHFVHGKASSDVNVTSIQDAVTSRDSRKSIGQTAGVISMAAPYGAIQYRDGEGGLHGMISGSVCYSCTEN